MTFVEQSRASKLPSIAAVTIIHVAIGYAFLSGLAYRIIDRAPTILQLENIRDIPPPPPLPTERTKAPPPPASRSMTTVERPLPLPTEDFKTVALPPLPETTVDLGVGNSVAPVDVPPPPVRRETTPPRARGERAGWITADDYPPSALRAGETGTVSIAVRVGADGRVTGCTVTGSSGSALLDQATCRLYPRRARYAPAVDASGAPVEATVSDRVVWRVPR